MDIIVRKYTGADLPQMIDVWNEVVDEGIAFPQLDRLDAESGPPFFASQSFCGVAENPETREIVGLYILHPNNVGRCGHICNASYAVKSGLRGLHTGEKLVTHCINQAREIGFRILQFNAVVKTNYGARHLYEKLDFTPLGAIPEGFLMKDGGYEDIVVYYRVL